MTIAKKIIMYKAIAWTFISVISKVNCKLLADEMSN